MSRRRYSRRQLLAAGLGIGLLSRSSAVLPSAAVASAAEAPGAAHDLPLVGSWAQRALAALESADSPFARSGEEAVCDLGRAGRIRVSSYGNGAVRVTLTRAEGELEMLRPLKARRVGWVEARLTAAPSEPVAPFDTLRRVPGGFELTFSSPLALRHAKPQRLAGEMPVVYDRLAEAVIRRAYA